MDAVSSETIAIACDHAGYELKDLLAAELRELGYGVLDLGTNGPESVDYPDFGNKLALALKEGKARRGVLVCGTGIGISIAANRHAHIRAAVVHDATSTRLAREHNDANVMALGARLIGIEVAKECLRVFLATEFAGGRHARRIEKLTQFVN